MPEYVVRIDVAHTYTVEAANQYEAEDEARDIFDSGEMGDMRVTETLVFDDEEEE